MSGTSSNFSNLGTSAPADWPRHRAEELARIVEIQFGGLPPAPDHTRSQLLHECEVPHTNGSRYQTHRLTAGPDAGVSFGVNLLIPPGAGPFPVVLCGDACWRFADDAVADECARRGFILALFNRTELAVDTDGVRSRVVDAAHSGQDAFSAPTPRAASASPTCPGLLGEAPLGQQTLTELAADTDGVRSSDGLYSLYPGLEFGAVSAWAWGYHRCVDFLCSQAVVRADQIAIVGHSRGGKATLLAGATDERIALISANNSGTGGAGSYHVMGPGAEPLEHLLRVFPHWLGPRMAGYTGCEADLPFDQHGLIAAIAPRAYLSTEALGDLWANPSGTWHAYQAAREAWRLLDAEARIGIHFREGAHDHGLRDWQVFLDFADWQFGCRSQAPTLVPYVTN